MGIGKLSRDGALRSIADCEAMSWVTTGLAVQGDLAALRSLGAAGTLHTNPSTYRLAAAAGKTDALRLFAASSTGVSHWDFAEIGEAAALAGRRDTLAWLWDRLRAARPAARSEARDFLDRACLAAAARCHLDVLRWLRFETEAPPFSAETMAAAAGGRGDAAVMRWLREEGCPWDARAPRAAAAANNLAALRWLRERPDPCPWDEACRDEARDPQVLAWLDANGCPRALPWHRRLLRDVRAWGTRSPGTDKRE